MHYFSSITISWLRYVHSNNKMLRIIYNTWFWFLCETGWFKKKNNDFSAFFNILFSPSFVNQQLFLNTIYTAADNLLVIINDILDLSKVEAFLISQAVFLEPVLNGLMSLSRPHWLEARKTIADLLSADNPRLRDNAELRAACLVPQAAATMHLPATIGDYTDFYSSIGRAQGRDPLTNNISHAPKS